MSIKRPNVLFFLSDQHQADAVGYREDSLVQTPGLDRLAQTGVVFDHAYCTNPLCVPSRSSLLTGRYCRKHGLYDNQHILEANSMTLPRALVGAGYRTALVGKAHFNGEQFHGFQERPYGDLFGQAHQPDPRRLPENGESGLGDIIQNAGPSRIPLALTQTEICVAESSAWLQAHARLHRDQPFYLAVHFDKPHFPYNPPAQYYERYRDRVTLPAYDPLFLERSVPFVRHAAASYQASRYYGTTDPDSHRRALAAYYGCVSWMDDAVGRVLDVLHYLGMDEDTIIVYTSDHGEMGGHHGLWQKTVFFDQSTRVPFIMRIPDGVLADFQPGRRSEVVSLVDLFPTLLELAGLPGLSEQDGMSLVPVLQGRALSRKHVFVESTVLKSPHDSGVMIRTERFKCALYLDHALELYDMENDPEEQENLAYQVKWRSLVHDLSQRLVDFWQPDQQLHRYQNTPRMQREKHFYPYSNQFVVGNGVVVDASP